MARFFKTNLALFCAILVLGILSLPVAAQDPVLSKNSFLAGDFNGDGKINTKDLTRLKKVLLSEAVCSGASADFNNDGTVNASDVTSFRNFVLKTDEDGFHPGSR